MCRCKVRLGLMQGVHHCHPTMHLAMLTHNPFFLSPHMHTCVISPTQASPAPHQWLGAKEAILHVAGDGQRIPLVWLLVGLLEAVVQHGTHESVSKLSQHCAHVWMATIPLKDGTHP